MDDNDRNFIARVALVILYGIVLTGTGVIVSEIFQIYLFLSN